MWKYDSINLVSNAISNIAFNSEIYILTLHIVGRTFICQNEINIFPETYFMNVY